MYKGLLYKESFPIGAYITDGNIKEKKKSSVSFSRLLVIIFEINTDNVWLIFKITEMTR